MDDLAEKLTRLHSQILLSEEEWPPGTGRLLAASKIEEGIRIIHYAQAIKAGNLEEAVGIIDPLFNKGES